MCCQQRWRRALGEAAPAGWQVAEWFPHKECIKAIPFSFIWEASRAREARVRAIKAVVPARARRMASCNSAGKIRLRLIYLAIQPRQTVRRRLFRSRHLPRWLPVWVRVAAPAAASMGVWDSFPDSRASGGWEERISPAVSAAAFSAISRKDRLRFPRSRTRL